MITIWPISTLGLCVPKNVTFNARKSHRYNSTEPQTL